jgi:hypothetical protein
MCSCIPPQQACLSPYDFSITLHWKPVPFRDHLVLDNSAPRRSEELCHHKKYIAPSMRAQRFNLHGLAVAALASAAIEAVCLWGLYSWIQWNFLGRHPVAVLEEWSMMTALVVHLPPMWVLLTFFHGGGVARWPALFLMGYSEWFFAIAAILWARWTLQDSLRLRMRETTPG